MSNNAEIVSWSSMKMKQWLAMDDEDTEQVKRPELPPEVWQELKPSAKRAWEAVLAMCGEGKG